MRSDQKQKLQGIFAAAALVGVPFLLNACSGNPLNGEKLRLWKNSEASTPPPGKPTPAKPRPTTTPTGTPTPPANVCKPGTPDYSGQLEPDDESVKLDGRIAAIEATQPKASDLKDLIMTFADKNKLGLKPQDLKSLQTRILKFSKTQATALTQPTPAVTTPPPAAATSEAPAPTSTTAVAPTVAPTTTPAAPYILHPSIVALVAYERAVEFATDQASKFGDDAPTAAAFADLLTIKGMQSTGPGESDLSVLVYMKTYAMAMSGLGYSATTAQKFTTALFSLPRGDQMALTWVATYNSDIDHSHFSPADAIADANTNLGYTINPSDPVAGFCGIAPAATPATPAVPKQPAPPVTTKAPVPAKH